MKVFLVHLFLLLTVCEDSTQSRHSKVQTENTPHISLHEASKGRKTRRVL